MARYPIAEIFYSIQGEGRWLGKPMIFIRLAGCSVKSCHIRKECDTDWSHGKSNELKEIVDIVRNLPGKTVSITGGEPTDHDLNPLLEALDSYDIHLETSGIRAAPSVDWLTVSPKTFNYSQRSGDALKIVMRPEWSWHEIDTLAFDSSFKYYYLQPLTVNEHPVNMEQVLNMVQDRPTWQVSIQAHRLWRIR